MLPDIDGTMGHKTKTRCDPRHGAQCVIDYTEQLNLTTGDCAEYT